MAEPIAPVPCPKCNGPMYDNSRDPKRKPQQSDYRCKDRKNCDGGIWLTKEQRNALPPLSGGTQRQAPQGVMTNQAPAGPPRRPLVLDKVLLACVRSVQSVAKELMKEGAPEMTEASEQKYVCSLFIARLDNRGILELEREALEAREKKAREKALQVETERRALEAKQAAEREAAEAARQASESQLGSSKPRNFDDFPAALEDQDDDLPF